MAARHHRGVGLAPAPAVAAALVAVALEAEAPAHLAAAPVGHRLVVAAAARLPPRRSPGESRGWFTCMTGVDYLTHQFHFVPATSVVMYTKLCLFTKQKALSYKVANWCIGLHLVLG